MNTEPRPVIIDCDPGQDDAVMLLMAMAAPRELDILGITTVAGNVPLALTQRNARLMTELAGRPDLAVYAGSERPMYRDLITAEYIHGQTGIDGADIHEPANPLRAEHAVDFILSTLETASPDSVTLVATGPLTNLGWALERRPDLAGRLREIVLMGGAMREGGNYTPSAEFNMRVDPDAAQRVLRCGRPLTIAPLDVSHQVIVQREVLDRLRRLKSAAATATLGMLEFFNRHDAAKYGTEGAPLHDPCTIAWLLRPTLFEGKRCNVEVETVSPLTLGHTAVDFWGVTDRPVNALWLHAIDAAGFFELMIESLNRYEI